MKVSAFNPRFDRDGFSCGIDPLDRYLKRVLSQDIKRNAASGFVLHEKGSTSLLGYYTLSAAGFDLCSLPEDWKKRFPRYPQVPATLLGRLAISKKAQGKGLGELLLMDALNRAWRNRDVIASSAVIVDAINDDAKRFYEHFTFEPLENSENRLFLPMKKVAKLFE